VFAAALSLLLHALIPGLPFVARARHHRKVTVATLGDWRLPRSSRPTKTHLAPLQHDRNRIDINLGPLASEPQRKHILVSYRGLGSWIDIYNAWVWAHPWRTVAKMHKRGVETIYLQTATHGSTSAIAYPKEVGAFLVAAHRNDMRVVGWYVPSFARPGKDFRRARTGLRFETKGGHRFDSFALDIEAPNVDGIYKRNVRLLEVSKKLRAAAGTDYPLGAVIPDSHSLYWPRFPYKRIAAIYDVMVPMGYFTFRAEGFKHVERYTENNIATIRKETGRKTPIHVIGGIADEVGVPAARGFASAVKKKKVLGASLYDYPITTDKTWKELSTRIP
jgi:hypothetical protein